MGGSYGGYSTLIAMTKFAGAYDAGVSIVGISNLVTFLENTAPYRRILRTTEYGDPEKDRDALVELSADDLHREAQGARCLIQGDDRPARAGGRGDPDVRGGHEDRRPDRSSSSSPTRATARAGARTRS